MSNEYKRVEVRDGQGRYGRLDFATVMDQKEIKKIEAWYQSRQQPAPKWLDIIKSLPMGPHQGNLGWWKPCRFQKSSCMETVPQALALDVRGLGWEGMLALREHQKELMQWVDEGPLDNEWREKRNTAKEYNFSHTPTPFSGSTLLDKLDQNGVRVEAEQVAQLLEVQCHVVYSPKNDAYLTAQYDWKGLNRAVLFTNAEDALQIIKQRKIDAQVASTTLKVEHFSKPELLGPLAREAMAQRQAVELETLTPETPNPSPRRHRL